MTAIPTALLIAMQILHLDSSLQGEASASRQLSRAVVDALLHIVERGELTLEGLQGDEP